MKRVTLTILCIAALALVIGCGAAQRADTAPQEAPPAAPMPAAEYQTGNGGGVTQSKAVDAPASGVSGGLDTDAVQDQNRMIVYNGSLSLQVNDTAQAVSQLETILQNAGGYISNKSLVAYGEDKLRGTVQVRLPAASLNTALPLIKALGVKVLREDQSSNDVTEEYTDLDARRRNLEAYEVELQKLLDTVRERTGKAEDILAVYNQLTEVRGQIEQIQGRQKYLENTSTLATYTVEFVPVEEVVVQGDPGWNPGQTARQALDNLVGALQSLGDIAIIFFLNILPLLIIVAIPFVLAILAVRFIVKRRAPKKPVTAG